MAKDYYKILGVKKTDSKEAIKKAYRDAVKRLHPDVTGGHFDKKRFYEIQEAYETLGDEEKRKMYDRSQEERTSHRRFRKEEEVSWASSPFEDLFAWMRGWETPFQKSRIRGTETRHRVGITLSYEEAQSGGEMVLQVPLKTSCTFCGGKGYMGMFSCPVCGGAGVILRSRPVRVDIPSGVEDGTVLNVPFVDPEGRRHTLVILIEVDWFA